MSTSGKEGKTFSVKLRNETIRVASVPTVYAAHQPVLCKGTYWLMLAVDWYRSYRLRYLSQEEVERCGSIPGCKKEVIFPPQHPNRLWNPLSSLFSVYRGLIPAVYWAGRGAVHPPFVVPRLRIRGSMPPFHSSLCLMVCTEATLFQKRWARRSRKPKPTVAYSAG
jgi:hypothetical protein